MTVSLIDRALLANAVYDFEKTDGTYKLPAGWTEIDRLNEPDNNGFQAAAYKNEAGDVVIAYRGTDQLKDVVSDLQIPFGQTNQYRDAKSFFDRNQVNAENGAGVVITGHSLGGALGELIGAATGKETTVFNAPGVANILPSVLPLGDTRTAADFTNISNHNLWADAVSTWGTQLGSSTNYAPTPSEKFSFLISGAAVLFGAGTLQGLGTLFGIKDTVDQHFMDRVLAALCMPTDPNSIDGWKYDADAHAWYKPALNGGPPEWAGSTEAQALDAQRQTILDHNVTAAQNYQRWHDTNPDAAEPWSAKFSRVLAGVLGIDSAEAAEINISDRTSTTFNNFSAYPQRTDPFTLDLDGDGIETVGVNPTNPLLFDIDADGIQKSIGWIKADDGLLALDRDGNGTIDSGAELFGDATPLYDANGVLTGRAADGFDALAQQDSNADGVIDNQDTNWTRLRIWQDLNQDGISQGNELKTLSQLGILNLHVAQQENSLLLSNGNVLADLGSYTRTDGSEGSAGVAAQLADIDLSVDNFHTQFADTLPITGEAQALPDMQGSGQVRSLREAASIDSMAGHTLANLLTQFSAATTQDAQMALMDSLLDAWAATSTMATTFTGAYAGHSTLTVDMQGVWSGDDVHNASTPAYQVWAKKLTVMERFNGRTYQPVPDGTDPVTLTLWHTPRDKLQASYETLKTSVYQSLILQTRLKPYLDQIRLAISDSAVKLDFSALKADFNAKMLVDPVNAAKDLIEFNTATQDMLATSGWDGVGVLIDYASTHAVSTELQSLLVSNNVRIKGLSGWSGNGSANDDALIADGANDTLIGNGGNDTLMGGGGNDSLYGGTGNDVLDGGTGNDALRGGNGTVAGQGQGNDTYLFDRGDGTDTIIDNDSTAGNIDTIRFKAGVLPTDVIAIRPADTAGSNDLLLSIAGTADSIRVSNWFVSSADRIEQVVFDDGTVWNTVTLLATPITGTAAGETIYGRDELSETLDGQGGNDTLLAGNGNDVLLGGAGDDTLYGEDGNDTLDGGPGNDALRGGVGVSNNQGQGNDTYLFGRGDGTDTIIDNDSTAGNIDTIRFKEGVLASDVMATRPAAASNDLLLSIAGTTDSIRVSGWFSSAADRVEQVVFDDGTVWNTAFLLGTSITGSAGNETLTGGSGDEIFDGGAGIDTLIGNGGNDTLMGGAGDDVLYGGTGNDILDGGTGNDALRGGNGTVAGQGQGNDTYLFGRGDGTDTIIDNDSTVGNIDTIRFKAGVLPVDVVATRPVVASTSNDLLLSIIGTTDSIRVSGWFSSMADRVEQVVFEDGTVWTSSVLLMAPITGGVGNETLTGGISDEIIDGGAGIDTLIGNGGNDTLLGGAGDDTLYGGTGNDVLDGGTGNDALRGGNGTVAGQGQGNDTYLFGRGDGTDTIIDNDSTAGNIDTIRFKEGVLASDVMATRPAAASNDLLLSIAGTTDSIRVSGWFSSAADRVEQVVFDDGTVWNTTFLLATPIVGTAGSETINGTSGNDNLQGGAGNDILNGLAGNDTLDGGTGNDTLVGGSGNDVYIVDAATDVVTENASEGNDTVQSSVTWTLGNNVENLTLTGSAAVNGTGNALDNVLIGNGANNVLTGGAGNDSLDGGGGNDTMAGGAGNDSYVADAMGDAVIENVNEGTDTVQAAATHTLGANVEDLILTGTANIDGTGNALGNSLAGNVGNNVLRGMAGNDTLLANGGSDLLDGGDGDDIYYVDATNTVTHIVDSGGADKLVLLGATMNDIELGVGSLKITVKASGQEIHLDDFDPADPYAAGGVEQFQFADGTVLTKTQLIDALGFHPTGTEGNDTVFGTALHDVITALGGDDTISSFDGDDLIYAGDGNDTIDGGAGNDLLGGGNGDDIYRHTLGGGNDRIEESCGTDRIEFGAGIGAAQVVASRDNGDVILSLSASDSIRFAESGPGSYAVEQIVFADGTEWHAAGVLRQLSRTAPLLALPVTDQVAQQDMYFELALPTATFSDADAAAGDTLAYTASLVDGGALPSWLSFDANTRTFSGMPGNLDVGDLPLLVTAIDLTGNSVAASFNLQILNVNDAPVGMVTLTGMVQQNELLTALSMLEDADGLGTLGYQWQSSTDGNEWSDIAGATSTSFALGPSQVGQQVRVVVSYVDGRGTPEQLTSAGTALIANVNDAPVTAATIDDLVASEDEAFFHALPADSFTDTDSGDTLSYSVTREDGSALPAWLVFNPGENTLRGTPANDDVGSLSLRVTATDAAGASASQTFSLSVLNLNDAPVAGSTVADQTGRVGTMASFRLPANAFIDVDGGDSLQLSASLSDGQPLPDWLSFDAPGGQFICIPSSVGRWSLTVTATDAAGASASQTFNWTVSSPLAALSDQASVSEDGKLLAMGNVLTNDVQATAISNLHVLNAGVRRGSYGVLALRDDGTYGYVLDNRSRAVQSLGTGQAVQDVFAYTAIDGTNTASSSLTVTISGRNDRPELVTPIANRALKKGAVANWDISGSFRDIDFGDTLHFSATQSNGKALPTWLRFNAQTGVFSGQAPANASGALDITVTATDGRGSESIVSDRFRIALGSSNVPSDNDEGSHDGDSGSGGGSNFFGYENHEGGQRDDGRQPEIDSNHALAAWSNEKGNLDLARLANWIAEFDSMAEQRKERSAADPITYLRDESYRQRWQQMNTLLDAHLFGDDSALLGDHPFSYSGAPHTVAVECLTSSRNVPTGSQFAVGVQAFQSLQGLQEGVARLG